MRTAIFVIEDENGGRLEILANPETSIAGDSIGYVTITAEDGSTKTGNLEDFVKPIYNMSYDIQSNVGSEEIIGYDVQSANDSILKKWGIDFLTFAELAENLANRLFGNFVCAFSC